MQERRNSVKEALAQGQTQLGLWCSLGSALVTEVMAGSGCDWLLIDAEHSPNDLLSVVAQLQAVGADDVEACVRLPEDNPTLVKQFMDAGARSLMIPNVKTAEQARQIVASARYAPEGVRGFSVGHRANRFGRVKDYHANAPRNQMLILQIECKEGVANASQIAAVEGVDVLFVGPGDLSTNMGAMHNAGADHVQQAIGSVLKAAQDAGKAAGILAPMQADAERYIADGFTFVAVGADLGLVARGSDALIAHFRKG
ncbi:2-dehydro-3-deoxyglucarate aldolase [Roseovarius spongiae]|uniref:Hydroxypyruvate/pyruvate aldolase n=1 Tax=Roseovarius spongiae TaxID=2320272 RepID=A0A3A8AW84_9RHOB|nr:HpcH/HpaI aldolase/citrate lyase family protein [Roseovarius spongiae]RKF16608.1 2-dehydro-3-deoxyglucarate aldolase [Roseovarius spongiae]